jgi:hypothetical protein
LPNFWEFRASELVTLNGVSSWCSVVPLFEWGQGSLLSGMSGVTAHDARYASLQEERARPIYQRAFKAQGGAPGARRSKVQKRF